MNSPRYQPPQPPQQHQSRFAEEAERRLRGNSPASIKRILASPAETNGWESAKFWTEHALSVADVDAMECLSIGEETTETFANRLLRKS